MNRSKELKIGAVIAYFTIALDIISGVLFTPWIVKQIGDSDYGLYTLANSLINLFLFDFGLSAATSRFVSKYLAEGKQDRVDQVLGSIYKLYFVIDAIFVVVFTVITFYLETIYTKLTPVEIQRFRVVFIISAVFSLINFPCVTFTGILNAYEKFISLKLADAFNRVFRLIFIAAALYFKGGLYALVVVHVLGGLVTLSFKLSVIKSKTPIRVDFSYKEKGLINELLGFSLWVTVSTLAQRLVVSITPSILGIVSSASAIAVFGIVSVIENYIHVLTTALNGMFMPRISRIYNEENHIEKLNELIVKVGRFQFAVNGLIVTGFLLIGKDFIRLWLDESYLQAYYGILLITVPNLLYNSLQIANTSMMIKNQVKIQAITNLIVGIINVALSFLLSKFYGVMGACLAIFIAYSLRNIGYIAAYIKILQMDIRKLIRECYIPLGVPMLLTIGVGFGLNFVLNRCAWDAVIIKGAAVVLVYALLEYLIGMNRSERTELHAFVSKALHLLKRKTA